MDDSVQQRQKVEAQIERYIAEAKKLADAGKASAALELYRRAADELPGAPWLQHRTAELSRKLKQTDDAILYFRRAATAFQIANFGKRAIAPLRTAWTLAHDGLPGTSKQLVEVAIELMHVHRRLGFAADAALLFERTNATLRSRGFSEIGAHVLEALQREPALAAPSTPPPSSRGNGPKSDAIPRNTGTLPAAAPPAPAESSAGARPRALARLLARR